MFAHIFLTRLKCLTRDREMIFWTLMFPIVLAFFFSLAFGNLDKAGVFKAIPVAVIDDAAWQQDATFQETVQALSKGEDRLLDVTIADATESDRLLKDRKVSGILAAGKPVRLIVQATGMNQNILKRFLSEYNSTTATATSLIGADPASAPAVAEALSDRLAYTREGAASKAPMDSRLVYFYGLIAMACFYGGFLGSKEVTDIQANISDRAARINVAPVHKLKAFLSSASASLVVQLAEMLILLLFMRFALGIGFSGKTGYVLLTMGVGSIAGVSFGAFISAMVKKGEGIKTALLIGITMVGTTLAGMMSGPLGNMRSSTFRLYLPQ